ncbi:MAG TPA: hypothetical protein VFF81_01120 [Noviherbaspirillum sp.]|nr:hypothetical protein [Noviherbaspirillum sp.]
MKFLISLLLATTAFATHAKEDPAHLKAIIEQHKTIAAAHQAAAQCLASGKAEETCHAELAKTCKGLAIGKLCGMKHKH